MKKLEFLAIFVFFGIQSVLGKLGKDPSIKEFEAEFHKLYTPEEEAEAEKNLLDNEKQIDAQNELFEAGKADFQEAIMEWDDLSDDEFLDEKTGALDGMDYATGLLDDPENPWINSEEDEAYLESIYNVSDRALPQYFDARQRGIITPVKNQKSCGSCSAFASAAMHEACLIQAGASKTNMDLSEQQLVDCAYDGKVALGCKGAFIRAYPLWLANKNQGFVNHENNYPYLASHPNLKCQNVPHWRAGARISKALTDDRCNESKLKSLVYKYGAVVSVIYAGDNGFKNYKAGTIFSTCSNKPVTHAITVIGWGPGYWLIKNSWGQYWGDKGYIKVKMGTCGVGSRCAVTECQKYGQRSLPPQKSGSAAVDSCDISAKYGVDVTGKYTISYIGPRGRTRKTVVNCAHSQCTPDKPSGKQNSCYDICGRSKCGSK